MSEGTTTHARSHRRSCLHRAWQARLFAMAQVACRSMNQPWDAFRDRLKAAIAEQPERPYYDSWMVALEQLTGCSPRTI
jgi:Nitrile hydratase beta subunit, N-terminal